MALSIKTAASDEPALSVAQLTAESVTEPVPGPRRERAHPETAASLPRHPTALARQLRAAYNAGPDSQPGRDIGKTDDERVAAQRVALVFLERLRITYDVARAILFGSRARGDHRPDSDLDLVIVLNGRRGDFIDTKLDMAGIAFDVLMETAVLVQPFPMWDDDLAHPERFTNPTLIRRILQDGITLG